MSFDHSSLRTLRGSESQQQAWHYKRYGLYIFFWANPPSSPQCGRHIWMPPKGISFSSPPGNKSGIRRLIKESIDCNLFHHVGQHYWLSISSRGVAIQFFVGIRIRCRLCDRIGYETLRVSLNYHLHGRRNSLPMDFWNWTAWKYVQGWAK